jgi:hypothetical protein
MIMNSAIDSVRQNAPGLLVGTGLGFMLGFLLKDSLMEHAVLVLLVSAILAGIGQSVWRRRRRVAINKLQK